MKIVMSEEQMNEIERVRSGVSLIHKIGVKKVLLITIEKGRTSVSFNHLT